MRDPLALRRMLDQRVEAPVTRLLALCAYDPVRSRAAIPRRFRLEELPGRPVLPQGGLAFLVQTALAILIGVYRGARLVALRIRRPSARLHEPQPAQLLHPPPAPCPPPPSFPS